jgi:hypothetical protein
VERAAERVEREKQAATSSARCYDDEKRAS